MYKKIISPSWNTPNRFQALDNGLTLDPPDPPDPPQTPNLTLSAPSIRRPRRYRWRFRPRPTQLHSVVDDTLPLIKVAGHISGRSTIFLIDCGATNNFIDIDFARHHRLPIVPSSKSVRVADGFEAPAEGAVLRTRCTVDREIGTDPFPFASSFEATHLQGYDAILGLPWFNMVKPQFRWNGPNTVFVSIEGQLVPLRSASSTETCQAEEAATARRLVRTVTTAISHIEARSVTEMGSIKAIPPSENSSLQQAAIDALHSYADVFPATLPSGVPPSRGVEHYIELIPGTTPTFRRAYRLSTAETKELKVQLDELERLGFIQRSKSPYGAPVMFVKKKDGKLRLVVDYRMLNNITIKNRYPLPLTDELFDLVHGAKYFSKIDLRTGFYQIRVADNDVEKTAFLTRYGSFEFRVLPMGLCNAPATFMHLMNVTFKDYLDDFIIVFLDDILIFSKTLEEHKKHVALALDRLRKSKLYAKASKCELFKKEVEFLGHRIGAEGLRTMDEKVKAICEWPTLSKVGDVRAFLGLVGYYRKFIPNFSRIALPLTELTKNHITFTWGTAEKTSFEQLKAAIRSAPVLLLPNPELPFVLHTDASGFAVGAVLQQDQGNGLQPVAYMSKKMLDSEMNYPVHEQELLAIVHACQTWRHYLSGAHFRILTDHRSLQHFLTQPMLSGRQARWKEVLANFDFTIEYVAGTANGAADGLSRRPDHQSSLALITSHIFTHTAPLPALIPSTSALTPSASAVSTDPVVIASERQQNIAEAMQVQPTNPNHPPPNAQGVVVMPSQRCTATTKRGPTADNVQQKVSTAGIISVKSSSCASRSRLSPEQDSDYLQSVTSNPIRESLSIPAITLIATMHA